MSGGVETPRQKMIGMMYLVLTALLALQVSNSVLEKFIFIDETLREQVAENVIKNGKTLGGIEAKVKEKGDREADVKALDRAKEVREITTSILEYLDAVRETMVEITGGRDENGHMLGAKDYDKVGTMMVHGPTGKELKEKLNTYAADLSKLGGEEFIPLARDAKDIEIAKHDPEQNMKPFAEYYFEHTPTAAGMATISFMETEITNYEQKALENIAALVGAKDISFDQIYPIVLPVSNIVAAGTKFEGSLFITAASSAVDPTMAMNRTSGYPEASDAEVEVVDGKGKVSFTATPGAYNKDGLAEKKFMTYITMNDSTYEHEHIYFVAKPVIQIQSAAISSLYRNCGNELLVLVPALGTSYNPSFKTTGATNIKGKEKGKVVIIPTAPKVVLTVSSGGNLIGRENFTVKRIPKPTIAITSRGRPINLKAGVKAPGPSSLDLKAIAEANFAATNPKDARYRIVEFDIILARGSRPIKQETIKGKQSINLSTYRTQAKAGDRFVIEVKKVMRANYQNKTENVTGLPNTIFTISLH